MALFKIFGNFASGNTTLPLTATQGYCYFDKNTGKFYIDTGSGTAELGTNRLALNANKADKDSSGNSIIDTYLTKETGVTDVTLNTSTRKLQKTINGTTSDITQLGFIPGTGANSIIGGGIGSDISTATGKWAMAYGRNASASGNYSFGFGYNTQAKGLYSVAMGGTISDRDTIAVGAASLAVGGGVQTGNSTDAGNASGNYAVAIGYRSKAIGNISLASGYETVSTGQNAISFGKWNLVDNTVTTDNPYGTYAFAIGNGTAENARSNAFTMDWNGNTTIAGSLTLNGTTTITATDISNWNNSSVVSISPTLTSGTKIGTITIDGTSTDLYSRDNDLIFQNKTVATSSWVSDSSQSWSDEYGYKGTVAGCTGVTSAYIPTVVFDYDDLSSGNFAPYATCDDNGNVYIYAKAAQTSVITIPTIHCVTTDNTGGTGSAGGGGASGGSSGGSGSGLPAVTSADNGKILMVQNGAWAAVSLETWTGGSY